MPKITRKTQKIFCGNADNDQLAVFGSMATGSPVYTNDVEQLQSNTAYSEGWQAATLEDKAPFMEEMNGLQYSSSYQLAYILQQGIAEWDAETTYYTNSYVVASDGNIYKSIADNNVGNNPMNDSANWFNIALYGANVDLSNLSSIGADKLNTSKMYLTGSVSTDEQGYNQLEDMYHSTFDLSKFTVVGSPTITSDGLASGFSVSDYIQITNVIPSSNIDSFGFRFEFTPSSENEHYIQIRTLDNNNQIVVTKGNGKLTGFTTTNGTTYNYTPMNISLNADSRYILQYKQTIDTIYISVTDKETGEIQTGSIAGVLPLLNTNTVVYIGKTLFGGYARNPMDLKQIEIRTNNRVGFNGNKTGLDVIKPDDYTVVGSPTISADGVASGFSASNYIEVSPATTGEEFVFFAKGRYKSGTNEQIIYRLGSSVGESLIGNIRIAISSSRVLSCRAYANNIDSNLFSYVTLNINDGDIFECKLTLKKDVQTLQYKINDKEYILTNSLDWTNYSFSPINNLKIGSYASGVLFWNDSIDLNAFKIYVDNQLIYQPCLKIPYTDSKTGSKVVDAVYRDRVQDVYEQFGTEYLYYTIDEENKNFTLPMGEIYGMIESAKDICTTTPDNTPYGYIVNGTITDNNNVISGFSSENFARLPFEFSPDANQWDMFLSITTGSDVTTKQFLISSSDVKVGVIELTIQNSKLSLGLSSNGTSMNIGTATASNYTLVANTNYLLQLKFTGNAYILYLLQENAEPIQLLEITSTTSILSGCNILFGIDYTSSATYANPFLGSIDLNKSYIKVNEIKVWDGVGTSTSTASKESPAVVIENFRNGNSWYNLRSDGYIEQGGYAYGGLSNEGNEVWFLKEFDSKEDIDIQATIVYEGNDMFENASAIGVKLRNLTTNSFNASTTYTGSATAVYEQHPFKWVARGYIKRGEQ